MNRWKAIARDILPPFILHLLARLRGGQTVFTGPCSNWQQASAASTGYDAALILEKVLQATLDVRSGKAAFERDSVTFDRIAYDWPALAALMHAAARQGGRLHVLDFGGALGSSYFQNRAFLAPLPDVLWGVIEQAHYVEAGQLKLQDDRLRFYRDIGEYREQAGVPDVVIASSVLQYMESPWQTLRELVDIGAELLVLDRTIVNASDSDRIYVQQVPPAIYTASYPVRSLSEQRLLELTAASYTLLADFDSLPFPALNTIDSAFKGYVFQKSR